jgi:hypothetical protein
MSSISLSLKMMLAASACAGLTLLACGEESSGGGEDDESGEKDDDDKPKADAGKKTDAGKKPDATITIPRAVPGEECDKTSVIGALGGQCDSDACDDPPCYAQCEGDVYGECKSMADLVASFRDGGGGLNLPDTGVVRNADGGFDIVVGDSSVALPTSACPADFTCSTELAAYGAPNLCTSPEYKILGGLGPDGPAPCETAADCKALGLTALACQELPVLGKICFQSCE